jgi:hypothetical protein
MCNLVYIHIVSSTASDINIDLLTLVTLTFDLGTNLEFRNLLSVRVSGRSSGRLVDHAIQLLQFVFDLHVQFVVPGMKFIELRSLIVGENTAYYSTISVSQQMVQGR